MSPQPDSRMFATCAVFRLLLWIVVPSPGDVLRWVRSLLEATPLGARLTNHLVPSRPTTARVSPRHRLRQPTAPHRRSLARMRSAAFRPHAGEIRHPVLLRRASSVAGKRPAASEEFFRKNSYVRKRTPFRTSGQPSRTPGVLAAQPRPHGPAPDRCPRPRQTSFARLRRRRGSWAWGRSGGAGLKAATCLRSSCAW